ncbi:ABC transporter substrate-binding protein [Haloarcula nitratireducens]|uniref:ABC transporter substrate-binding protein n=1 Tax=Haloarcula nitratireducens TaxID=2487749 RepID=A0AAW4PFR3_9EURY|nr:ABC transporter substrate-binding protein [Halomicroarcula nitratireducens]MBX0296411.1 ABC transporter substrate-binding protein [Halomicroarcula nitratireducens]
MTESTDSETGDRNEESLRSPDNTRGLSRRRLLTGLGTAGATALAGCSANPTTPDGGDLRIGTLHPPVTLDPIEIRDVGSAQMAEKIFDSLYAYDESTELVPQIATGRPQTDESDRRYTVEIREDATFQNGQSVLAEDVKYSFEAPVEEDTPKSWRFDMIESIETPDDRTVRFNLAYPYPAFTHSLTHEIVPKSVREAGREKFAEEPVGAGPFEVRHFSKEKKAKVVRWKDYWGEPKPAIAKITAIHQESPITRMMSLVSGRNRIIEPVSPRIRDLLSKRNGTNVGLREGHSTYHIGFNLNDGPTTDETVRKAIDYCIDMDKEVEKFIAPVGERVHSPLPEEMAEEWDMPLQKWRDMSVPRNTSKAEQLFSEAGVNKEIEILVPKDPKRKEIGRKLATGIREAGQRASVSPTSWEGYLEKHVSGSASDYMVYIDGTHGGPDPDSFVYQTLHHDQEGKTQGIFYDNADLMERIKRARKTSDREKRRGLYESIITEALEDRALLPAYSYQNSFGYKDTVEGFRIHPNAQLNPRVVSPNNVISIDDTDFLGSDQGGGSR